MKRCIATLIICFALLSIIFLFYFCRNDKLEDAYHKVDIKYDSYNNLDELFIGDFENHKVYYVGISNLYIDNTKLEEYIKSISIYDLKKLFNRYIYLEDGGTQAFYCDNEEICNPNLKIIYCNTMDNNTNIYIGELKDEFSVKICSKEVN